MLLVRMMKMTKSKKEKEYLIKIFSEEDADIQKSKLSTSFWLNDSGLDLLLFFARTLRNEMDRQLSEEGASNEFEQDLYSLFQCFSTDIGKIGDHHDFQIDKMLSEYVANLKNENLAEKYSVILEKLGDLRQERIRYWENILERVENNLEEYSVKLTKLQKNRFFNK